MVTPHVQGSHISRVTLSQVVEIYFTLKMAGMSLGPA